MVLSRSMRRGAAAAALACVSVLACLAPAGPIVPPGGPVAPTPGPEPRTPLSAATTPGDADSLFRITQPGSYYLTGNITGVSGKRGIEIAAGNVTIDLNGFTLAGVAGSLEGIASAGVRNITVRNGDVTNWGGHGISLDNSVFTLTSRIDNVRATLNNGSGIRVGRGAVITNCAAAGNGGTGIVASSHAAIEGCISGDNGGSGMTISDSSVVRGCSVNNNDSSGIVGGGMCTITDCTITNNGDRGITVLSRCTIARNTVTGNDRIGIRVNDTCYVLENVCASNGFAVADGAGILAAGSSNRIERNAVRLNDIGIRVNAAFNVIIGNTAGGNSVVNYEFASGNRYGPVLNLTSGGTAAVSGSSAPGTLTSSDPHANISH